MGKPEKKLKKFYYVLGITGVVYAGFRFLLPLVVPFCVAWCLAVWLRPAACRLAGLLCFSLPFGRRKRIGLSVGAAGALLLLLIGAGAAAGLYLLGRKACAELSLLAERLPVWIEGLDRLLTRACCGAAEFFCVEERLLTGLIHEMLYGALTHWKESAMPFVMGHSVTICRAGIGAGVFSLFVLIATSLLLQEEEIWKKKIRAWGLWREYRLISGRIRLAAGAYLKAQGLIMLVTSALCSIGFFLMGNPFYLLAGVGVGILDALPIIGTGTILLPWALILLVTGRLGRAVALIALYAVCSLVREILEAKLIGARVGLTSFETLAALYVGFRLFGIAGFLLGPLGLLLIRDFVGLCEAEASARSGNI